MYKLKSETRKDLEKAMSFCGSKNMIFSKKGMSGKPVVEICSFRESVLRQSKKLAVDLKIFWKKTINEDCNLCSSRKNKHSEELYREFEAAFDLFLRILILSIQK